MITETNNGDVQVVAPGDETDVAVGGDSFFGPVVRTIDTNGHVDPSLSRLDPPFGDDLLGATATASLDRAAKYAVSASAWIDAGAAALAARQFLSAHEAFLRALELESTNRRAILG